MNNPAFHATNADGVEIYLYLELIGRRYDLEKYRFNLGKHAGLVLRVIEE